MHAMTYALLMTALDNCDTQLAKSEIGKIPHKYDICHIRTVEAVWMYISLFSRTSLCGAKPPLNFASK